MFQKVWDVPAICLQSAAFQLDALVVIFEFFSEIICTIFKRRKKQERWRGMVKSNAPNNEIEHGRCVYKMDEKVIFL